MSFKYRLNWDKPRVVNPSLASIPWIVLIVIIFANICAVSSGFSLIIADSSIQGALVIGEQKNMWLSILYFLVTAGVVPIANRAASSYGYKTVFFVGSVLFFLTTLFTATTSNYWVMVIFRSLSGVGGGAIFPTSITLIDQMFAKDKKSFAIALYIAFAFGVGAGGGVLLGGYYAEFSSWRMILLCLMIFAPIVLILTWLFVYESERKKRGPNDIIGISLYIVTIGSLVTWIANVKAPWNTEGFTSNLAILTALLFLISIMGFIWREVRAKNPLLNLSLFKIRPFILSNLAIFMIASTFFSTTTNLTQIFEKDLFYSKYHMALLQIPFGICIGFFGAASGWLSQKIGIRIVATIGMGLTIISCFTNHSITIQSGHAQFIWLQIIRGTGVGLGLGPFTALALRRIRAEDIGQAAVIITLFRQFGGALGSILIQLIQYFRYPFHLLRFGEQMQLNSPALKNYLGQVETYLTASAGSIPSIVPYEVEGFTEAASFKSLAQLINYAEAQANILSINDAYWIIGWISSLVLAIILFFMLRAKWLESRDSGK